MFKKPGLYLIATPIGNLLDITLRALEFLKECDVIYCEDTRTTRKLLEKHLIVKKKLRKYTDHDTHVLQEILEQIDAGAMVALVSDAGTPLISDPGYKLVRYVLQCNRYVDAIPGPCAIINALSLSGLPTDSFYFGGFLAKTVSQRKKQLYDCSFLSTTLVFYDTAPRLEESLRVSMDVLGDQECAVVREMTKVYQEAVRGKLSDLIQFKTQGELVLLIANRPQCDTNEDALRTEIMHQLQQKLSTKQIVQELEHLWNKKQLYKMIQEIKTKLINL